MTNWALMPGVISWFYIKKSICVIPNHIRKLKNKLKIIHDQFNKCKKSIQINQQSFMITTSPCNK